MNLIKKLDKWGLLKQELESYDDGISWYIKTDENGYRKWYGYQKKITKKV